MASKLPHVDKALLEYLEQSNADRFPIGLTDLYELGRTAGKIELIRHLRRLYEDQVAASLTAGLKGE